MTAKQIAIAHPVSMSDVAKIDDPDGYMYPFPKYGIVTHEAVPPGTVIIWPQGGADPVVMDVDQLTGKLTTELSKVQGPTLHPLTSPIPPLTNKYHWSPPSVPWPAGSFQKAVMAEMKAVEKHMFEQMKYGAPSPQVIHPPEPPTPTTEFIDSSNPFAKALDAWQTGKAEWVKGSLYQPATQGEPV